ncbi:fatty acid--CoA ligase [Desulfonema ishimotonii]|uniref:Fatty acid--CoA ligase n=1 Tax=Desulfonema ishimotonii TaxID=45657 RepID=A0A401G406_9BACT|nr:fatty acid--CoA ligase [Desulfonema ishimotonii]GBC63972.1 fatty acid--CoA ligase [Desulfonema ishimotonii]
MTVRKIERAPLAYDYPLLIKNLLRPPLRYSPQQEIVYKDIIRYNYLTLEKRIARLANLLKDIGIKQGETVGIMDWDSHRYLESFFAVPMMGCVLHTVNFRRSPENLAYTINHAENRVLLINEGLLPLFESVKDQLKTVRKLILLTDDGTRAAAAPEIAGEYEALLSQSDDRYDFPDFDEDAMATILYTTGSTGTPKGVCFSHRQLVMHTYGLMAGFSAYQTRPMVNAGDVYMPLTPMFHVHAWGLPYLFTLMGGKQVYPGKYDPETILNLIATEQVTFSHCVPTLLHTLVNCPTIKEMDMSAWKVIIGGAALSGDLCRAGLERGINLFSAYGMSETGPLLAAAILKPEMEAWDTERQIEKRCRTGLPASMVDLEIVDITGKPIPHDGKSIGEVIVRAPWLSQGYAKDPLKSADLWADGWLHTGDIGFIDPDGYLQVTDRLRDAIKTGGEWIASMELEDIIREHEAVSEAAVTAVPDEKWGEKPLAIVVLRDGYKGKVQEEDIRQFCMKYVATGALPRHGVPEKIAIVDTIPTTSVGKISKKQLKQNLPFNLEDGP